MIRPAAKGGANLYGQVAQFEEVGLAFEEVGEELGILDGQGAELVEERLLGLQLLAERKTWVAVHEYLQAARADGTRRTWRPPWGGSLLDAGNSKWSAGNLLTGAPSGPFASARTS